MAVDLASNITPFEFEKMLPLDVLATVASETLKAEVKASVIRKEKYAVQIKRNSKKSYADSNNMTFQDIKALSPKCLVERFSEMNSDELTKRYSYKCILFPDKCDAIYKSYGNEKRACDKMKSHLLFHIQELREKVATGEEISFPLMMSSSYRKKNLDKYGQQNFKPQKKPRLSLPTALPETICSQNIKCAKKSHAKKLKEKIVHKSLTSISNQENKSTMQNSSLGNGFVVSTNNLQDSETTAKKCELISRTDHAEFFSNNLQYNKLDSESIFNCGKCAFCSLYCKNISKNEEVCQQLCNNDIHSSDISERRLSYSCDHISSENLETLYHDHSYATVELKNEKSALGENKQVTRGISKKVTHRNKQWSTNPELIIKTPPFPFVHIPVSLNVGEIIEIAEEEVDFAQHFPSFCDTDVRDELSEDKCSSEIGKEDNNIFDLDENAQNYINKPDDANGSVLECVENRVNMKHCDMHLAKSALSNAETNDENIENMQKSERELALKLIAKLHAKRKKKIYDSLKCQICKDKQFTAVATLIHHYRGHARIKLHLCEICGGRFTRKHSLNYHMSIHLGHTRFSCEFCGRLFRHPSHYKDHLRRHTGETPYHCTDCDTRFKTRNTYKRHLKTRHQKLLTAHGIEDLEEQESLEGHSSPHGEH